MFQIIVGVIMVAIAYKSEPRFAPVLFVEGMILINLAIGKFSKRKSIAHL